jgi:hypothetical protein
MRRYFESLRPADVSAIQSVPDGIFLSAWTGPSIAGTSRRPITNPVNFAHLPHFRLKFC